MVIQGESGRNTVKLFLNKYKEPRDQLSPIAGLSDGRRLRL